MELAHANVLIVDDNAQVRTVIATAVGGLAAGIDESSDAISGLELWLARRPHLIFVDYEMPELNGATFIKILRRQEAVLGLRSAVLMVTGHSDRDHVVAAREAGADGFLIKPLSADTIVGRAVQALASLPEAGERRIALV